eukprot:GHVN01077946.1.p1 GENE.GHVN01077946.1~~GHVN01077946.1.p1  ORF type:complete len:146 (+),score=24.81 GHVN01077946.1:220-657(+)
MQRQMQDSFDEEIYSGVILITRIPHGFYENEMDSYFSQYGKVLNVSVARNRKGNSKHYGFVKFESKMIARKAAQEMNNYLMFGCLLQCKHLLKRECFVNMFKQNADEEETEEKAFTPEEAKEKQKTADLKREQRLKELGVDFTLA